MSVRVYTVESFIRGLRSPMRFFLQTWSVYVWGGVILSFLPYNNLLNTLYAYDMSLGLVRLHLPRHSTFLPSHKERQGQLVFEL